MYTSGLCILSASVCWHHHSFLSLSFECYTCLQECLSVTQKTLLLSYKETVDAQRRDELQRRISSAIEEAEEEEVCGCPSLSCSMMWSEVNVCTVCPYLCVWYEGRWLCGLVCWHGGLASFHCWADSSVTWLPYLQLPPKRDVVPFLRMKVTDSSSYMGKTPSGTPAA